MKSKIFTITATVVLLSCLLSTAVVADNNAKISMSDTTLTQEETATIPVVLEEAPNGVSGYTITATTGENVEVTSVTVGGEFTAITESITDAGTIEVTGTDFSQSVGSGAEDVVLFELEVTGSTPGTSPVTISVDTLENAGEPPELIEPTVDSGQITVRETSNTEDNEDSEDTASSDDSEKSLEERSDTDRNDREEIDHRKSKNNTTERLTESSSNVSNSSTKTTGEDTKIANQDEPTLMEELEDSIQGNNTATRTETVQISGQQSEQNSGRAVIQSESTETVKQISFSNSSINTTIRITDYQDLPQSAKRSAIESIDKDLGVTDGDSTSNNSTGSVNHEDGSPDETPTNRILSLTKITPVTDSTQVGPATVELRVDRSKISNRSRLAVIKTQEVSGPTDIQWVMTESSIQHSTDDKVIIVSKVDSFSLFAVTEMPISENTIKLSKETNRSNVSTETTSTDLPGFGIGIASVSVLTLFSLLLRKR
jgi:hypothetical protein